MAQIEVLRNEYTIVYFDPKGPLIRQVRTDIPFPSLEVVEKSVGEIIRLYDELGRAGRSLLVDLRAPQGRNDTDFEECMAKLRPRLYGGFVRVGMLVRSSVGALQIRRMVNEDGIARLVATDETVVLDYLLHGK